MGTNNVRRQEAIYNAILRLDPGPDGVPYVLVWAMVNDLYDLDLTQGQVTASINGMVNGSYFKLLDRPTRGRIAPVGAKAKAVPELPVEEPVLDVPKGGITYLRTLFKTLRRCQQEMPRDEAKAATHQIQQIVMALPNAKKHYDAICKGTARKVRVVRSKK